MNRRGFLIGTLATAFVNKLPTPVVKVLEHIPGLRELIRWATAMSVKAGYELANKDIVGIGTDYIERKAASDALGSFVMNDMMKHPEKYLP